MVRPHSGYGRELNMTGVRYNCVLNLYIYLPFNLSCISAISINFSTCSLRIMFERVWISVGLVCEACDLLHACDACVMY